MRWHLGGSVDNSGKVRVPAIPDGEPVLSASSLMASGPEGTVFGPVDLDLYPGELCIVTGDEGSGKSAFLLTLSGRFRGATGDLTICGIDALARPYEAIQNTAVARLGNYVLPEDRLTVTESISERAYLDGISLAEAERRAAQMEEILGFRIERGAEIEQLDPVTRIVGATALVALRPARVIVVDDVDAAVPHADQVAMYQYLIKLAQFNGAAIVCTAINGDTVPKGVLRVRLASRRRSYVHAYTDHEPAEMTVVDTDPVISADPLLDTDTGTVIVTRTGEN